MIAITDVPGVRTGLGLSPAPAGRADGRDGRVARTDPSTSPTAAEEAAHAISSGLNKVTDPTQERHAEAGDGLKDRVVSAQCHVVRADPAFGGMAASLV